MLSPVLVTASSELAISLEEAKQHIIVEDDENDPLINLYVAAAVREVERELSVSLTTQAWRQEFSCFSNLMRLRPHPVDAASIVVTYRDADDVARTLATDVYRVHTDAEGAYVRLSSGQSWPQVRDREDAVSITFSAGWAVGSAPADLKIAVLMRAAFLYANRESHSAEKFSPTGAYECLVWSYRRPKV